MKRLMTAVLFLLFGCAGNYTEEQLVGEWRGVEWKDVTNERVIDVPVDFTFGEDGRYIGNYGAASEKGKYWISGDNLHTIEDGKAEKKVKIAKLRNDSLLFEMNRAGNLEEMLLIRAD